MAKNKSTKRKRQTLKVDKKHIIARWVPGVISGMGDNAIYFEIAYHEVNKDYYSTGFGSYYIDQVLTWFDEELELVSPEED